MVYDPRQILARTWADVLEVYRALGERNEDFRPLRRLVEHILSAGHSRVLFSATSMTSLLVARHADTEWATDSLRVDVDLSGAIRFTLHDPKLPRPTTFTCQAANIVRVFDGFVRKARWV